MVGVSLPVCIIDQRLINMWYLVFTAIAYGGFSSTKQSDYNLADDWAQEPSIDPFTFED